jgi:hypothetical protein
VGALVQQIPFGGELVIAPDLLDVDERALPFAKKQMLEGRKS